MKTNLFRSLNLIIFPSMKTTNTWPFSIGKQKQQTVDLYHWNVKLYLWYQSPSFMQIPEFTEISISHIMIPTLSTLIIRFCDHSSYTLLLFCLVYISMWNCHAYDVRHSRHYARLTKISQPFLNELHHSNLTLKIAFIVFITHNKFHGISFFPHGEIQ
jgi:hypothetical protein